MKPRLLSGVAIRKRLDMTCGSWGYILKRAKVRAPRVRRVVDSRMISFYSESDFKKIQAVWMKRDMLLSISKRKRKS